MTKFSIVINSDDPSVIAAVLAAAGGADVLAEDETPNAAAPAVDSKGLPWDARIHASTKRQNADGGWKAKSKVDAALVAQVEAELRARVASPIPQQSEAAPGFSPPPVSAGPAVSASPNPSVAPVQGAVTAPTLAVPVPNQVAPTVQPPVQTPPSQPQAGSEFNTLMTGAQRAMNAGLIDIAGLSGYVAEINAGWGTTFTAISDLHTRPEIAGWAVQLFTRDNRWIAA